MSLMNRIGNAGNPAQGKYKKVLCVCSAGLLRSPTAAFVLSQEPFNFNTRAAGIVPQFALIQMDQVLAQWADEIVCMEAFQEERLDELLVKYGCPKPIINLQIEDDFHYRDKALMKLIAERYMANGRDA